MTAQTAPGGAPGTSRDDDASLPEGTGKQLVLDLGHIPSMREDDFIVADGNELAFRHILAFPDWAAPLTLVQGPAKAGKSHLAAIWMERSAAIKAGPFEIEGLAGAGGQTPVLIEDADRGGYPEAALFHLLNQSMRDARPVLITARTAPEDWPLTTNDVRSRIRLASRFTVEPADDIQLSQMFVKLFGDRQIAVDPKIINYLVRRMERSPQEVVALVGVLDRLALSRRSAITRTIAAEAICLRATLYERGDNEMD